MVLHVLFWLNGYQTFNDLQWKNPSFYVIFNQVHYDKIYLYCHLFTSWLFNFSLYYQDISNMLPKYMKFHTYLEFNICSKLHKEFEYYNLYNFTKA